jgi:uncharacterized protein YgiM (DUF1202 family)
VQFLVPQIAREVDVEKQLDNLDDLVAKGRIVNVARTHMLVRKKPVDGEILGKISSPSRVTLIERNGDWCRVFTARKNIGWMACWGLDLGDVKAGAPPPVQPR